jgi:transcriptional regulator with XRE-family HTH domain
MPNNLRKLREAKGLSQGELANAVNLTQGAVSYIERMGTTPRGDLPKAIAQALGCRVSTVFPDTKPEPKETVRVATGPIATSLAEILRDRSPSELGRIVTMLEAAFPR